jgi:hypothetical protein
VTGASQWLFAMPRLVIRVHVPLHCESTNPALRFRKRREGGEGGGTTGGAGGKRWSGKGRLGEAIRASLGGINPERIGGAKFPPLFKIE